LAYGRYSARWPDWRLAIAIALAGGCAFGQAALVVGTDPSSGGSLFGGFTVGTNGSLSPAPSYTGPLGYPGAVVSGLSGRFLYQANGSLIQFDVGPNGGALTREPFVDYHLNAPTSITTDISGRHIYQGVSPEVLGVGNGVAAFSIDSVKGTPLLVPGAPYPTTYIPQSGIAATAGNFLYLSTATGSASQYWFIEGFKINPVDGTLTKIAAPPAVSQPFIASLASDPSGSFLMAPSYVNDNISVYRIDAATGALTLTSGSPYPAPGAFGVSVDRSGRFVYLPSYTAGGVYAFTLNAASGVLAPLAGSPFSPGSEMNSLASDVSGKYLYGVSWGVPNILGFSIDGTTGALTPLPGFPVATVSRPGQILTMLLPANRLVLTLPARASAGDPLAMTISAMDRLGNVVVSFQDRLHFASSDPAALLPANGGLSGGTEEFQVTLTTSGSQTVTVTDLDAGLSATQTVLISPAATSRLQISAPSTAASRAPFYFTVTPQDAFKNTTFGYPGSILFTSTDPLATLPPVTQLASGSGTLIATLETAGSQTIRAHDTLNSLIGGTSNAILVPSGILTGFRIAAPTATDSASLFTFTVTAADASGNAVPGYAGTVHFTSSDANAILPPDSKLVAGEANFNATLRTLGNQTITARDAGNAALAGTSGAIAVSEGTGYVAAIVNAASLESEGGAPNSILSAFDAFPGCGAETQATVDGTPTAVFYASPTQINFLLPGGVAGKAAASVQFSCSDLKSTPMTLPVAAAAPALFTAAASSQGQAALVNQDGSVDTASPAGTIIQLYGTGFGALTPPDADGLSHLALPVTATVGAMPATVIFAGQAPGYTTGLQQINVRIPANAPSGASIPLALTVAGSSTQVGVVVAIP
jgi:uncharacterized protein (TIGR03437 family)